MPWEGMEWPYTRKYNIGDRHAYPEGAVTMTLSETVAVTVVLTMVILILAGLQAWW